MRTTRARTGNIGSMLRIKASEFLFSMGAMSFVGAGIGLAMVVAPTAGSATVGSGGRLAVAGTILGLSAMGIGGLLRK
jgi:hypothetical protein